MSSEEKVNPLVSVVMATFNDDVGYLARAVNSILQQDYKNLEFIIVDDSTDMACKDYLRDLAATDRRIHLVQSEQKLGFVRSLNKGVELSRGKYIARMDSDDESYPYRIGRQVRYLESNPCVDILGGSIDIIDDEGAVSGHRNYHIGHQEIKQKAYFRNPLAHPTVMYRSIAIKELGGYDERFAMAEDYELWLRALRKGFIINNLPDALLKYRICNDYYRKRSSKNWRYNILAKWRNRTIRVSCAIGLAFSVCMYICPQSIMKLLYERDRKTQEA